MGVRRLIAAALIVAAAFSVGRAGGALAHNGGSFFPLPWNGDDQDDDGWVEYKLDSNDSWPASHITAVDVADAKWSDIDTDDAFVFDRIGYDDWDTCFGLERDNVVSKSNLGSGEYGHTTVCPSASTNAERFHLELNTADFNYFWGSGSEYLSGEVHARGILADEFGHAAGGWLDPFVGHWDEEGYANLCQHSGSVEFHTMCSGVSRANSWKQATLEQHDVHTFENAYPG
jgi:hypothetical protein